MFCASGILMVLQIFMEFSSCDDHASFADGVHMQVSSLMQHSLRM